MRLNFMRTVLGWCMTTQLWHEMPLGRPPQQLVQTMTLPSLAPVGMRAGLAGGGARNQDSHQRSFFMTVGIRHACGPAALARQASGKFANALQRPHRHLVIRPWVRS